MNTHRKLLSIISFLTLLILSGCNSYLVGKENLSKAINLPSNPNATQVKKLWQLQVGEGNDKKTLQLHPLAINNIGFIASADGNIISFNKETGQAIWHRETGHQINAGVGGNQRIIVIGNSEGLLMVYNSVNGNLLWKHQLSSEMVSQPLVINNTIVVRAIDGQVTALDAETARVIWKQNIGVASLSIRGNSRGLVLNDSILYTTSKGEVALLSLKNGKFIYSSLLITGRGLSEIQRISDIIASPTISNNKVFFSAYRQKTVALNLEKGNITWESPISTSKDLFTDNKYLYLIDRNSIISAIDVNTGKLAWQNTNLIGRKISPITGNGKYIITTDFKGYLIVISAKTGQLLSYDKIAKKRTNIPALWVANNSFLIYSEDGQLSRIILTP